MQVGAGDSNVTVPSTEDSHGERVLRSTRGEGKRRSVNPVNTEGDVKSKIRLRALRDVLRGFKRQQQQQTSGIALFEVGGDVFGKRFTLSLDETIHRAEGRYLHFFKLDVDVVKSVWWQLLELGGVEYCRW